jgi:hypothetical protein
LFLLFHSFSQAVAQILTQQRSTVLHQKMMHHQ